MSGQKFRPEITLRNRQRGHRLDISALQNFAEKALELCLAERGRGARLLDTLPRVDVVLVSDRRIAALHQQFMQIAGPTDVLTFHHGEIVVSVDTAARNSTRFKASAEDELRLYIVHGLLHLHGYGDKTAAESKLMRSRQTRIVSEAAAALGGKRQRLV